MKKIFILLEFVIFSTVLFAQSDTAGKNDDEMNIFLLVFAIVTLSVILGAAVIGAFAATLLLLFIALFIGMGILSVSVMAGLYTRSLSAAFKTLLYIICMLMGLLIGAAGFILVSGVFHLGISNVTALIAGTTSGLLGGLLMAVIVSKIFIAISKYFKTRFQM